MSARLMLAFFLASCLLIAAGIAVAFQDNITKFNLSPRTPYQTYTPPPPPSYGARGAWAIWPGDPAAGVADVFYVHSTTYSARSNWNARPTSSTADETLRRVAIPNEAGPFASLGAVYAPRYRQATLFAAFTHRYDSRKAFELAFRDVEQAFLHYLSQSDEDRPIILVGYGQGGLHVLGLLQYHFAADEALRRRLAAAYVIGQPAPKSVFSGPLQNVPPCASPDDFRCVVSYIDLEPGFEDEERRYRARAFVWSEGRQLQSIQNPALLCVNPLVWRETEAPAPREDHLGAASATGLRLNETPPAISKALDARCEGGILNVTSPRQSFLHRRRWFGDQWRPQDFNLFYYDLTADARRRVESLNIIREEERLRLEPIDETVDLDVSPVNKVPH